MALVNFTNDATGNKESHDTKNIRKIAEVGGKAVVTFKLPMTQQITCTESLQNLYDQQGTTGYELNMLLITRKSDGTTKEIYFTHDLKEISQLKDGGGLVVGATLKFKDVYPTIETVELVAALYGQQAGATNIGLVSVTRKVTGQPDEPFVLFTQDILKVFENSISQNQLVFNPSTIVRDDWIIAESADDLFNAQAT